MPARRDGIPIVVRTDGSTLRLERLLLQDRQISEGWLQERLHNFPELLPVEEIDPSFGPLIAIGREIGTPVGAIDNLYISPQGLLTIVEAKLWRNPQARREVVGQILDYAKELSRWSYEELNDRAKEEFLSELEKTADAEAVKVARRLHDDFLQDLRFEIRWGSSGYQLKLRDPGNPSFLFTMLLVAKSSDASNAYVGWLNDQLGRVGLPSEWGIQYFTDAARIVGRKLGKYGWDRPAPLADLAKNYNELKALIEAFAEKVQAQRSKESGLE